LNALNFVVSFKLTHNDYIPAGRDLTDELPAKYCFSIYYIPAKEAETPGLRVFCCYGLAFLTNNLHKEYATPD